jgi:hypothetical protein
MILAQHNAHLLKITGPSVQGDPVLGIPTQAAPVKWQGDAQASLRDQTTEEVRGNLRILLREVLCELPNNMPYEPQTNDLLTFKINTGETMVMEVRVVDRQFWGLGRYRYTLRYGTGE